MSLGRSAVLSVAATAMLAGCELTGARRTDAPAIAPAPIAAAPAPAPAPPPPPAPRRPALAEIDARLKLLVRLRRFHEAGELYDANADLVRAKVEFTPLLRQIADGLNRQYDAPLGEAAASLARYEKQRPAPEQLARATEAIAAAREVLKEYGSVQLIQDLQQVSPAARRLALLAERAQATLELAKRDAKDKAERAAKAEKRVATAPAAPPSIPVAAVNPVAANPPAPVRAAVRWIDSDRSPAR